MERIFDREEQRLCFGSIGDYFLFVGLKVLRKVVWGRRRRRRETCPIRITILTKEVETFGSPFSKEFFCRRECFCVAPTLLSDLIKDIIRDDKTSAKQLSDFSFKEDKEFRKKDGLQRGTSTLVLLFHLFDALFD